LDQGPYDLQSTQKEELNDTKKKERNKQTQKKHSKAKQGTNPQKIQKSDENGPRTHFNSPHHPPPAFFLSFSFLFPACHVVT
jgi:hypothetical protein